MSLLVTGHEGFIGSALMKFFKNKGYFVYGMEKSYLKDKNYSTWQINLLEYLEIIKPDCVFHVGACADTQNYDVNYMMKYNAECTMLISNWCKAKENSKEDLT